jgi:hypothetical protein
MVRVFLPFMLFYLHCGTEGLVEIGIIRVFLSAETEGPMENQFQQHLLCSWIGSFNFLALACPALHKMSYASIDILEQASGDKNLMLTSRKMAGFADWVVVNNMLAVDKLQDTIVSLFFLPTSPNPR